MKLFSTTSVINLACKFENFSPSTIDVFSSLELKVSVKNSRENDKCCVLTSISNINDYFELLLLLNALRNYRSINLIILYMFYTKQDKDIENSSFGAKLTQTLLQFPNIKCVYHLDIHSNFFEIENHSISAEKIFIKDIIQNPFLSNPIIIAPDKKAEAKVINIARELNTDYLVCDKKHEKDKIVFSADFQKVEDRNCIIVDDIVDTGQTIVYNANELNRNHAKRVVAYCTHGVLSRGAMNRISSSCVKEIVVTDSIFRLVPNSEAFRCVSLLPMLRELIDGML